MRVINEVGDLSPPSRPRACCFVQLVLHDFVRDSKCLKLLNSCLEIGHLLSA